MAAAVSEAAEATAKEKAEAAGEKGGGGGGGDDSEEDEDDVFEVEKILDVKTEGVRLQGAGLAGERESGMAFLGSGLGWGAAGGM